MARLKSNIQRLLRRVGLYERLKASSIYDLFWFFADRSIVDARNTEVLFYRSLLQSAPPQILIFDVGANHGQKTDIFLRLGARVIAIEPDRSNQIILAQKFLRLRWSPKPVTVVGKAVSEASASATMWVDAPGSAKNTLSQKWVQTLRSDEERFGGKLEFAVSQQVDTTTLDALMTSFGDPFYVKIDVEGHEPSVLRGLKRPVRFLSFEVNLPEFLPEGLECVKILERLSEAGRFNLAGECQSGLTLAEWLPGTEFASVLNGSKEKSVEVFWKTPA